jgi:opacity protein-like surface antigen
MMKLPWLVALGAVVWVSPALAQEQRVEVSVLFGWALSEGVDGDPVVTGDGNVYNRVDPKDSFKWGLSAGVLVTEDAEAGFLFGQQRSTLQARGTNTVDVGDMTVNTYHGYFAYNFLDQDDKIRPYLQAGLGATNFSSVDYTRRNGQTGTIGGVTRLSTTWGAGVKLYPSPNVGARLGVQWTPTYIKSDAVGWWCDLFWGCYVVGNAQYSHQFDFSGGITFRF